MTALGWLLFKAGVLAFSFVVAVVAIAIREARTHGWGHALCLFWACEPDDLRWERWSMDVRCVRCGRRLFP